jgi:hypothetical protein
MSEQPPPPPPGGRWMRDPDGQWQWVPDQQGASSGPPHPPPSEQPPQGPPPLPPGPGGWQQPTPPPKRPNWIVRHPYWSIFIVVVVIGAAATGGGVSGTSSGSHSASAVAASPSPGDGGIPSDLPSPPTDTANLPSTLPSESPSASPSPSPSPSPPPKPKPKPPVAKYSGVGDDVISIHKPASVDLVTATSTGGENNFVIEAKGPNDDDQLLVNTIGNYHGTTLMDAQQGEESTTLQVSATGSWSIILRPTWTAQHYTGGTFNGTGDSAVIVSDSSLFKASFSGPPTEDNFVVEEYTNGGDDNLLVNVVNANYHGTVPLSPPGLIMVTAAGPWSMSTS